jgi:hypothetical protein
VFVLVNNMSNITSNVCGYGLVVQLPEGKWFCCEECEQAVVDA